MNKICSIYPIFGLPEDLLTVVRVDKLMYAGLYAHVVYVFYATCAFYITYVMFVMSFKNLSRKTGQVVGSPGKKRQDKSCDHMLESIFSQTAGGQQPNCTQIVTDMNPCFFGPHVETENGIFFLCFVAGRHLET